MDGLESVERARILSALASVEELGVAGAQVQVRHIEDKLWEIKVSRHRVFYVLVAGPEMVLLHAYKKQGQKAPLRELDVARQRAKEVLNG